MKRFLILAFFLSCAALSAGAASVTPSTAAGYIFSQPLYPWTIRGEVMGTPPAYLVIRSEDIDWIEEAVAERSALVSGSMPTPGTSLIPIFGTWPLSESNRFVKCSTAVDAEGVTNIVVGYTIVTNNASSHEINTSNTRSAYQKLNTWLYDMLAIWNIDNSPSGPLDGSVALQESARVAYPISAHNPAITNVYVLPNVESVPTNEFSVITLPTTNGVSGVFTNSWSTTIYRRGEGTVVTNVGQAYSTDYCHEGDGRFPGYVVGYDRMHTEDVGFEPGAFECLYEALRGDVRLSDSRSQTNSLEYVHYLRMKHADKYGASISTQATTNTSSALEYSIDGSSNYSYEWNQDKGTYDLYYGFSVVMSKTFPGNAIVITRFKSDVVTTGGFHRVAIEAAFAWVSFVYNKNVDHAPPPYPDFTNEVNIANMVVVPLVGGATLDLDGPDALASVYLDMQGVANLAAAASGAPQPPGSNYEPPMNEEHSWTTVLKGIVLIYKITPSTKFNDW